MQWRNTNACFGAVAKCFHWTSAAAFIGAYLFVYYVIWFMDDTLPESWPVLNIHWALGLLVGFLVHPFLGKWVAWVVVVLHVAAALFHHYVRRDDVLQRMLPCV